MRRRQISELFQRHHVARQEQQTGEAKLNDEQLEEVADIFADFFAQPVSAHFLRAKSLNTETTEILERTILIPDNSFIVTYKAEISGPEPVDTDHREYTVTHFAGAPFYAKVTLTNKDTYPPDYITSIVTFLKWMHLVVLSY